MKAQSRFRRVLNIDIETYSEANLPDTGVYRYVADPSFEVLLFAYAVDGGPVHIIDLASGEKIPADIEEDLEDPKVLKKAYNANFERTCLGKFYSLNVEDWECSMVKAGILGLPMNLDKVGEVLNIDARKIKEGEALIRYFCKPCKPTKSNGKRTRNLPEHDVEKWDRFKKYCIRDVEAEMEVARTCSFLEVPDSEKELFWLDQRINDTGVEIDADLVDSCIHIDTEYTSRLRKKAVSLTGLNNPNSPIQLKSWLSEKLKKEITEITKGAVAEMLSDANTPSDVKKLLKLRQRMAKTSVKKYAKMQEATGPDGRVRGLLQYYGANRTGRWAGRLVQIQNLPQNKMSDLELARDVVKDKDLDLLLMFYDNPSDVLSQLVRTAFVAGKGKTFVVADFSAIEARVIAWLAGEQWRLDVFNSHGKIYEASAARMLDKPIEEITKAERSKGKVAELALGYQGSIGALETMGALNMGLSSEELPAIVKLWRISNPHIVELWDMVNRAAIACVDTGRTQRFRRGISFRINRGFLEITLPSGRALYYHSPSITANRFGGRSVSYGGMDQITKQWTRLETYGGKLVENIVQAIARDCLAEAMLATDAAGHRIVMHVHDEEIIEEQEDRAEETLESVITIMSRELPWAKGLPLTAEGYITKFYKKD